MPKRKPRKQDEWKFEVMELSPESKQMAEKIMKALEASRSAKDAHKKRKK